MIILEDSDSNEYYRWRYWEEIAAARTATSPAAYQQHLHLAEMFRQRLLTAGDELPPASVAVAAAERGAEIPSLPDRGS